MPRIEECHHDHTAYFALVLKHVDISDILMLVSFSPHLLLVQVQLVFTVSV